MRWFLRFCDVCECDVNVSSRDEESDESTVASQRELRSCHEHATVHTVLCTVYTGTVQCTVQYE